HLREQVLLARFPLVAAARLRLQLGGALPHGGLLLRGEARSGLLARLLRRGPLRGGLGCFPLGHVVLLGPRVTPAVRLRRAGSPSRRRPRPARRAAAQPRCWMRTMLPAGSRKAQSRTP